MNKKFSENLNILKGDALRQNIDLKFDSDSNNLSAFLDNQFLNKPVVEPFQDVISEEERSEIQTEAMSERPHRISFSSSSDSEDSWSCVGKISEEEEDEKIEKKYKQICQQYERIRNDRDVLVGPLTVHHFMFKLFYLIFYFKI